jgi:hypothetical protein
MLIYGPEDPIRSGFVKKLRHISQVGRHYGKELSREDAGQHRQNACAPRQRSVADDLASLRAQLRRGVEGLKRLVVSSGIPEVPATLNARVQCHVPRLNAVLMFTSLLCGLFMIGGGINSEISLRLR